MKVVKTENSEDDLWVYDETSNNYDETSIGLEDRNSLSANGEIGKNRSMFRSNINRRQSYIRTQNSLSAENSICNGVDGQDILLIFIFFLYFLHIFE